MTDDRFFERLRDDAEPLRFEPGDFMQARIAARVRERIATQPGVAQLLARWFRPLGAALTAIALAATLSVAWAEQQAPDNTAATLDAVTSTQTVDLASAGELFGD